MSRATFFLAAMLLTVAIVSGRAAEPRPESYLTSGRLVDNEQALSKRLAAAPSDDSLRFALGAVQFVHGVEHLGQNLYRYGLRNPTENLIPFVRLPFGGNPHPETITYEKSRQVVADWITDFNKAQSTLAAIKDPSVALLVDVNQITLDVTGDGQGKGSMVEVLMRIGGRAPDRGQPLTVRFDRADVAWLRGYSHLLAALGEVLLAHDGRELFQGSASTFFQKADTPASAIFLGNGNGNGSRMEESIADLVAFVHLIRLPVVEPARMKTALGHFEQVLALSREMWKFALAETDNDHEWIPNPKQQSALGMSLSQPIVDSWMEFVEEGEALLQGKRLAPFWRFGARGINVRRVFTEPRPFDLVLWVQGSAALPYLEEGQLTRPQVWNRLARVFGGDFFALFLWIN